MPTAGTLFYSVRVFLPEASNECYPGKLDFVSFPSYARVDTGVVSGDEVSVHYDPMIAKVIFVFLEILSLVPSSIVQFYLSLFLCDFTFLGNLGVFVLRLWYGQKTVQQLQLNWMPLWLTLALVACPQTFSL